VKWKIENKIALNKLINIKNILKKLESLHIQKIKSKILREVFRLIVKVIPDRN